MAMFFQKFNETALNISLLPYFILQTLIYFKSQYFRAA